MQTNGHLKKIISTKRKSAEFKNGVLTRYATVVKEKRFYVYYVQAGIYVSANTINYVYVLIYNLIHVH